MRSKIHLAISNNTLTLSGNLDFDSVLDVAEQGKQWLKNLAPPKCYLDLSGLDYSNSVGIALLLSWLRIAQEHQKVLMIQQLPNSILSLAKLGGLESFLHAS